MTYTLSQIAAALGAEAVGAVDLSVSHVSEPAMATADALALAMDPKYAEDIGKGAAQVAMLWPGADWRSLGLKGAILAPRPRFAMAGLTAMMAKRRFSPPAIHDSAVIDPSAVIGAGVFIGPFVSIGAGVTIGANACLADHVSIAENAQIGSDAILHAGVRIGPDVMIGDRFIAQPGAVVGGDGFSFVTAEPSDVEAVRDTLGQRDATNPQSWTRIHSLGAVRIGDDVELGANTTIDRGTIRDTHIGNGCKVDNLAQIGHNVQIGNDCLICAQVGIAGSSRIGNNVVLGGQTGVSDNVFIGDNVITGGATKVLSNIPAGRVMLGYPAIKMEAHLESHKGFRRLPRLLRDVAALKKAVSKLDQSD
jgi:UDP-3-O-[3-hydroxymyristoyl] glucosamine N-acyltransferase